MTRAVIVVNPAARGGAVALSDSVAARLRRFGWEVDVSPTHAAGRGVDVARDAVRAADVAMVVAVGGDGTVREVAQGMAEGLGTWPGGGPAGVRAPQLVIVPAGTGNSVHRALWDDLPWERSAEMAERGDTARRDLDLARIAGYDRAVLLGCSAGFLRWVVEATARFPELRGRELYAAAGLAVAEELHPFAGRVTVDGRVLAEGPMALAAVGGARHRGGGGLALLPRSVLDDGLLDVCAMSARNAEEAIGLLMLAMEGRHLGQPGVRYAQGHEVLLEALDGPLPFEHDGEVWPHDDSVLELGVVTAAVPVVAPPVWEQ